MLPSFQNLVERQLENFLSQDSINLVKEGHALTLLLWPVDLYI